MKIIDLSKEHEPLYCVCLEDWSDEMKDAGNHKKNWYSKMKKKGLRVKLALNDKGVIGGMIQYIPIEHSFVQGENLYFILCIWVHGYKHGRGNFRKTGMGRALLEAAEEDVKNLGAKGIAAWGISLPFWMKASWFRKKGYKVADKQKMQVLLWKQFANDAIPPRWIPQKQKPELTQDSVSITGFINGWCPAQNLIYERSKRASEELGKKAVFKTIDTSNKDTFLKWGISDAVYIDNKPLRSGPPQSYKIIKKKILKKIKKL